MSFFIRSGSKGKRGKGGKGFVAHDPTKHKRRRKEEAKLQNVEISSEEEDEEEPQREVVGEDLGEEEISAQDKKVLLTKKYLAYLEDEAKDGEEDVKGAVLRVLHDEVLDQAGKLKKRVADCAVQALDQLEIRVLKCKNHKKSITCAAVTSDSKSLYSGSKDGVIVKWCLEKCVKLAASMKGTNGSILCLAVSQDGKTLASGDEGSTIKVWDPNTLDYRFDFKGHRGPVTGLGFCPFTGTLYSASRDRTVKVWAVHERAYVETLFGHQTPITALDVLAKDRVVTSGGSDYSLRLWKIPEESQLIFNAPSRSVDSVKRLDNKHFVSCNDGGDLSLWGVWRKKPLVNVPLAHGREGASGEANWLVSVAAVHNGDLIASGSSDGQLRLWKVADGSKGLDPLAQIPLCGFVNSLLFTPDDKYLIAGVGQEHRFGRWSVVKEARNALHLIRIKR